MTGPVGGVRHAAVLGHPVDHSRSPDLHLAAYRALGLDGWTYERIDCTAETLPGLVAGLDESWVGLSVTMPAKAAALDFADTVTDRARRVGSANTLVRTDAGAWHADCTDIDGVRGALDTLGAADLAAAPAVLLGAGGTARPALAALHAAGAGEVAVVVRDPARAGDLVHLADDLGVAVTVVPFTDTPGLRDRAATAGVVVSTVPAAAAAGLAEALAGAPRLVDAIYDPWPTPLAQAVADRGGTVAGGLVMLLHQAYAQVEAFTGRPAPREAMASAVDAHTR
ncbi:shikimate dehydrogenase [Williamsia serinedens]|uniref:Shikimate dehydrogenase n=1 Tax=Williamsia serinedens TaxID=391736 RepID=A0ABT1GX88_9NOCA|nr:shikimate dehydrogenase [Williamsia serinedens]MCP2159162.1 shikimate dehydrogenase [Williamsia serinedens]